MSNFTPKPGDPCLLNGAKVTYVGEANGDNPFVFENEKGMLQRFDSFEFFEEIDSDYEAIVDLCIKEVQVTNTTSMHQALKKLYDADMLKLPGKTE